MSDRAASTVEPMKVDMVRVVQIGIGIWVVALVAILLVPSWHSGERSWWPWVPLCGIILGSLGWVYVRRGRGNAAAA